MRLSALYDLLEEAGYRLRREPYDAWRHRLLDPSVVGGTALAPFASYLAAAHEQFLRMPPFDRTNTWRDLDGSGLACPPADRALIARYLDACWRTGFIATPRADAQRAAHPSRQPEESR
jgi:nonribosomal peptide synthetase MxcG